VKAMRLMMLLLAAAIVIVFRLPELGLAWFGSGYEEKAFRSCAY